VLVNCLRVVASGGPKSGPEVEPISSSYRIHLYTKDQIRFSLSGSSFPQFLLLLSLPWTDSDVRLGGEKKNQSWHTVHMHACFYRSTYGSNTVLSEESGQESGAIRFVLQYLPESVPFKLPPSLLRTFGSGLAVGVELR
jgi:hypothetical protein